MCNKRDKPCAGKDFGVTVTVTRPLHRHKPFRGAGNGLLPHNRSSRARKPAYADHMARTIEFDAQALIDGIDALRGAQLPYAGNQALKQLGYKLKGEISQEMQRVFRAPVQLTLRSPRYVVDGLEMTVQILPKEVAKGNSPASYLFPVTREAAGEATKTAYPTKFTRVLRNAGLIGANDFPVPYLDGRGVRKRNGRMIPADYADALRGLTNQPRSKQKALWRYFVVRDSDPAPNRGRKLPAGIYRAKGGDVQMLFGLAKNRQAPVIFEFGDFVERRSQELFPSLLSKALDNALK